MKRGDFDIKIKYDKLTLIKSNDLTLDQVAERIEGLKKKFN